jgi:hypothetical protein
MLTLNGAATTWSTYSRSCLVPAVAHFSLQEESAAIRIENEPLIFLMSIRIPRAGNDAVGVSYLSKDDFILPRHAFENRGRRATNQTAAYLLQTSEASPGHVVSAAPHFIVLRRRTGEEAAQDDKPYQG